MPRYIDADALVAELQKKPIHDGHFIHTRDVSDAIFNAPTIFPDDVRGVGYNKLNEYHTLFQCSVCGWEDDDTITGSGETNTYNYCPNCGAKMEVREDA